MKSTKIPVSMSQLDHTIQKVTLSDSLTAKDFLSQEFPSEIELVNGAIERGTIGIVTAPSKIGKSQYTLQLAMYLSGGISFCEHEISAPRKVMLVDIELRGAKLQRRINAVLSHLELRHPPGIEHDEPGIREKIHENLIIKCVRDDPNGPEILGNIQQFFKWCGTQALQNSVDLVVLDPIYRLINGPENDSDVWVEINSLLNSLVLKSGGAAVLYVHHNKKGASTSDVDAGAGSGVATRFVDWKTIIKPHSDGSSVIVSSTVMRDGPPLPDFVLKREGSCFTCGKGIMPTPLSESVRKRKENVLEEHAIANRILEHVQEAIAKGEEIKTSNLRVMIQGEFHIGTGRTKSALEAFRELISDKPELDIEGYGTPPKGEAFRRTQKSS